MGAVRLVAQRKIKKLLHTMVYSGHYPPALLLPPLFGLYLRRNAQRGECRKGSPNQRIEKIIKNKRPQIDKRALCFSHMGNLCVASEGKEEREARDIVVHRNEINV